MYTCPLRTSCGFAEAMQDSIPVVSVCIPTYRAADHLAATIESVLAQTFADFELVIVDDNSPDRTAEIVAGYRDSRLRYLQNPANLGPEGNWNRCLDEARGRYFKLLPQDDLLAPDCLARQVAVFELDAAQRIALVFGAREVVDADGKPLLRRATFGKRAKCVSARDLIRACLRKGSNVIGEPGNVLLRRNLADSVGRFDATHGYVIDLDYWFRALQRGDGYYLPYVLSSFRISGKSWSVEIGARQYHEYRDFARKYAADPAYRIGKTDLALATAMAYANARLRRIAYWWLLPKQGAAAGAGASAAEVGETTRTRS
jgi:glycosyltransferase involved in cell wall biosynthesis